MGNTNAIKNDGEKKFLWHSAYNRMFSSKRLRRRIGCINVVISCALICLLEALMGRMSGTVGATTLIFYILLEISYISMEAYELKEEVEEKKNMFHKYVTHVTQKE